MGTFEITGKATRKEHCDIANMKITFRVWNDDNKRASKKCMDDCERFLQGMEKNGISASQFQIIEDDVEENRYSENLPRYSATREIAIKLPFHMEQINGIEDMVNHGDYTATVEVNYLLSNREEIHRELINEAVLDSRKKAEAIADALGLSVVGVDSLSSDERGHYYDNSWVHCEEHERSISAHEYGYSNTMQSSETEETETVTVKWIIS